MLQCFLTLQIKPVFGVRFPDAFGKFLEWLSVPALTFSLSTGAECMFPGINYHFRLYLTTLGPIAVIVLVAILNEIIIRSKEQAMGKKMALYSANGCRKSSTKENDKSDDSDEDNRDDERRNESWADSWATDDSEWTDNESVVDERNGESDDGSSSRHHYSYAISIFILYIMLPPASQITFRTFACDWLDEEVDGTPSRVERLREDYSIDCDSPSHIRAEIFAYFMLLLWPIGVPLSFAVLLFRHRYSLQGLPLSEVTKRRGEDKADTVFSKNAPSRHRDPPRFDTLISRYESFISHRSLDTTVKTEAQVERMGTDEERLLIRYNNRELDSFRLLFDACKSLIKNSYAFSFFD